MDVLGYLSGFAWFFRPLVFYCIILSGLGFVFDKKKFLKNNLKNFLLTVLLFLIYGFTVGYLIS